MLPLQGTGSSGPTWVGKNTPLGALGGPGRSGGARKHTQNCPKIKKVLFLVTYFAPARNRKLGTNMGWQKNPPGGPGGALGGPGEPWAPLWPSV